MKNLNKTRVKEIFKNFAGKKIAVIGDIMLDRYFWGSVTRVSPEAPVPVIDLEHETFHLGGAANVASNLNSLGIKSILCGIIGDDNSAEMFEQICKERGIDPSGLYKDSDRPTTVKTRIIGNNQQIVRLDREVRDVINTAGEKHIISTLQKNSDIESIIFGDYDKGAISSKLIKDVLKYAKSNNIEVYADPKFANFFAYKGVTAFKPNKKEAAQALKIEIKTEEDVKIAGQMLLDKLSCDNVLLTLGDKGMMLFEANGNIHHVDTKARLVSDVSGAGDTVIATLAACKTGGANMTEAATIANIAAGYVCGEPGIVSVTKDDILSYL
ncbi:MAG: D-glycero-beta-D-manno-heptose-7-phosphate kinase [Ignavibacteriae bacterium HGW-Ignavibacteriae-4]|jgi:rfaE bifunctional protein kinase chain/domain|nr:MAG: D-glycero-beta-D-manno-heptose-7-phosphate kinase [Ignavibacteriae bacterium HGW-Ignavibacteriae-4]